MPHLSDLPPVTIRHDPPPENEQHLWWGGWWKGKGTWWPKTSAEERAAWLNEYSTELKLLGEQEMGRYVSEKGGNFTPAPAGNHIARCIRLVDLGTQRGQYQGQPTVREQLIVMWELPDELVDVGGEKKPAIISKFYTASLSEKANMRRDLEAWRGRPFTPAELKKFDINNILGATCLLNVVHDENGRARVVSISPLPKKMECAPAFNEPSAFWISEWNDGEFQALPEGFKKLIEASDEYKQLNNMHKPKPQENDGYSDMMRPSEDVEQEIPF